STRPIRPRSSARSARRRRFRSRTRAHARPPPSTTSGARRSGSRRFSSEPLEVGEPDLDKRPHALLEAGLARYLERLLEALAHLGRIDTLLEAVVTGHEQVLDLGARLVAVHNPSLPPMPPIRVLIADDHRLFA